jgi:hypothetical protein
MARQQACAIPFRILRKKCSGNERDSLRAKTRAIAAKGGADENKYNNKSRFRICAKGNSTARFSMLGPDEHARMSLLISKPPPNRFLPLSATSGACRALQGAYIRDGYLGEVGMAWSEISLEGSRDHECVNAQSMKNLKSLSQKNKRAWRLTIFPR